MTLAQMLANAKGEPIDYEGKSVMMSYKIPVLKGQEVEVEFLDYNDTYQQGFEVSIDQRKGTVEINGQKLSAPVFWTHTAPKIFSFKCYTKKTEGFLNIWNVWQNIEYKDNVDAWIGNSGMFVEKLEDGALIFHCSNGVGEVNFDDLVFKVKVK
ncbi:MAG: hypothetical protein M0Z31_10400 [Clostridia bacterium]|nr:hypothetical protein [Clostridia bacterium]